MTSAKKNSNIMAGQKQSFPSTDKSISINGDVKDSVVISGDNNVVNKQTIFQKIINFILPTESESMEQRNRRILLGHVENAWIKGVLDASLHGAAMLELGIKEDPDAVKTYPWALKKESTDETLPTGTSMLEIFDSIGMGRSLLILGAPGSGKTTMLLELARGLIARAREDVTQPIPMVFNLASWTEKLTLANWLAQELKNLYSVPHEFALNWMRGNKLLLLLDGLDEVRQESRAKCVEAINAFRKQNGLTSLAVCSRSQNYADLKAKLSFEGAIEVQPLTQGQIAEFFNRFGKEMAGIKQVLKKDSALREMAETPLFLSIMLMAYRDKQDVEIFASQDIEIQRHYLFDNYIERMFERPRSKKVIFKKEEMLHWLSWLAQKMIEHNQVSYLRENMQPEWLKENKIQSYRLMGGLIVGPIFGLISGLIGFGLSSNFFGALFGGIYFWLFVWFTYYYGSISKLILRRNFLFSALEWKGHLVRAALSVLIGVMMGVVLALLMGLTIGLIVGLIVSLSRGMSVALGIGLNVGLRLGLFFVLLTLLGIGSLEVQHYTLRLVLSISNLLPWRLVPFLNHCVDLIFLRRVGGGYIFVHRLLMEHFAERLNHD